MKKAPENYDTTQIFNDLLYLAERLRGLEDTTQETLCHLLDIGIDFYSLRAQLNKFGANWVKVVFHPDCDIQQRERIMLGFKRLPPLKKEKKQAGLYALEMCRSFEKRLNSIEEYLKEKKEFALKRGSEKYEPF